ncbi:prephenate dehydrogenase [Kingella negevensis]|uniref:prephenate dehydrogenase n=1 Tax=Kingella negevensis TaxID=1522312 RepID=A0A238T9R2_9NEIS|nr:prephenate dehydrogenase [Kingella negevensis]MDK4679201.1 prephenate dehydrogenase [Kingella negevensis]MDK4683077.1 prephenate dehydrogenase [Kingella negevensis]MDK4683735.1 prephenate dehydrogenase [Kingella negevensis]MDK4691277.1 prephenate dehydrogenase [Kingella negevensis]MDK4693575.1 prephenate dehydrogenase [Kingella negevensis]
MTLNQITLIGVGLIGGSFVLDLKRQKRIQTIIGIDLDLTNLECAIERRVIDIAHTQITPESVQHSDLILIATPVATLPKICATLAPMLPENIIISDVGSTKQSALAAFKQHLPKHYPQCVAAHPIAGSDRSGALVAQFGLYQNKKLILCPHEQQDTRSLKTIAELWQTVGANVHQMTAQEHDQIFAAVSHFPHLLAFAYVHQMLDDPNGARYLDFAGSGFRDFTRIAASSPDMWRDIALVNRDSLLQLIAAQKQQLDYLERSLKNDNAQALWDYFQAAKQVREEWGETH